MFDKRNSQISIWEAESFLKNPDVLEDLEDKGLIEIYCDNARLSDTILSFFESVLVDGYESELYHHPSLFKKIEDNISFYWKSKNKEEDCEKYIRQIYISLRKFPNNLMASFEHIRKHVEFTYKEISEPSAKKEELETFRVSLEELSDTLEAIHEKMKLNSNFFDTVNDTRIRVEEIRLNATISSIRTSLSKLIEDVVTYIAKAEASSKFYAHIQGLVELLDKRDFKNATNIIDIVQQEKVALYKMNTTSFKHKKMKLHPEEAYEEEFALKYKSISNNTNSLEEIKKENVKVDLSLLNTVVTSIIDYESILDEYLLTNTDQTLLSFIMEFEVDTDIELLVESYLNLIVSYEDYFVFMDTYTELDNRLCIDVKKREKA